MQHKKRESKSEIINIRVQPSQKEKICRDAKELGMSASKYLIHLANHKKVVIIEDGKILAKEIYELNKKLNRYESYSRIPVDEIRDIISTTLMNLKKS